MPSSRGMGKKMWSIDTMDFFSAINKYDVISFTTGGNNINKLRQSQKDSYHVFSHLWLVDFNVDTLNCVWVFALKAKIKLSQGTKETNRRRKEERKREGSMGEFA